MRAALTLSSLVLSLLPAPAIAEQPREPPPPPPPLVLEAVEILPRALAPDTLCQLRVQVRNRGERAISQLAFRVTVNGQELPVYRNQLFMQALPPGELSEVRLYNFWSTETGRPAPADGRLRVDVALTEAQWYRIADEEGVEVWTPLGEVPGLPASASVDLSLAGAAAPAERP
jgi:hypothetical protein